MTKEVPRTSVLRDEELIARLQNSKGWPTLGNAAADRIEQLVATNEALIAKLKTSEEIGRAFEEDAGQLRAKLAKAVAELEQMLMVPNSEAAQGILKVFARALLAELKGDSHE